MKLGGNLSPGPDALLFSRSGLFVLFVTLLVNVSAKSKGYVEAGDHDDDEIRSYCKVPHTLIRHINQSRLDSSLRCVVASLCREFKVVENVESLPLGEVHPKRRRTPTL